ncbi:MAG: ABC transporter permease [Clostridia bacterium]|nr:ABC transporter permease [Clostridia bacterium]
MFSIKLALRNIVRMPKRTVVNLLLFLLVVASVFSGIIVYNATEKALAGLDESYTFVATLVPSALSESQLLIDDFRTCFDNEAVLEYNIVFDSRIIFLPREELLYDFISETDLKLDSVDNKYTDCVVRSTNDLYLERGFFEGKFKMVSGGDFSEEAYDGNTPEIILPKWFADEHGINVGDKIVYYHDLVYYAPSFTQASIKGVVVGIYENTENPLSHTESGAYIPMQFMMRSGVYTGFSWIVEGGYAQQFSVERADFVLRDRDAIYPFIENAVNNGFDSSRGDVVFNNAEYDIIREGLLNVRVVVVIFVLIVSAAGAGILVTFTINMIMARRREKEVLRAVGMKKSAVALMFTAELLIIAVLALPLGYISGRLVSNAIFRYADSAVESNIEELDLSEKSADTSAAVRPLSCNIRMSMASGTVETSVGKFRSYRPEGSDSNGVCLRITDIYNSNAANYTEAKTSVYTPLKLAVADTDDISPFVLEDHAQEIKDSIGHVIAVRILSYVPRSSGYEIGDRILAIANLVHMEHTKHTGLVAPMYLLVCGYFDDELLGLDGDVFLTTEEEFVKTKRDIYIEILPHCDMVINPTEK